MAWTLQRITLPSGLLFPVVPLAARAAMPAPRLIAPGDEWTVSRLAADFRWEKRTEDKDFWAFCKRQEESPIDQGQPVWHLQLARDRDFNNLLAGPEIPLLCRVLWPLLCIVGVIFPPYLMISEFAKCDSPHPRWPPKVAEDDRGLIGGASREREPTQATEPAAGPVADGPSPPAQ